MKGRAYIKGESGASAAEFAMTLPILLLFAFGLIEFGMILFTNTQLHFAVEDAARCAAVRSSCMTNSATNSTKVTAWASSTYKGLAPASFSFATNGACSLTGTNSAASGMKVTGNTTFKFNIGVFYRSIPMQAEACFPA